MTLSMPPENPSQNEMMVLSLIFGAFPLAAILAGAMYLHARSFDPTRIIGCYKKHDMPLIQVTSNSITVFGEKGFTSSARLTENNYSYGIEVNPGLEPSHNDRGYAVAAEPPSQLISIDVNRRVPVMKLVNGTYDILEIPWVPCPSFLERARSSLPSR